MTALLMPVLIGMAGAASDTIQWTLARRTMQRQVDSSALAGAFAMAQGRSAVTVATAELTRNENFTLTEAPVVSTPPPAGKPYAGNASAVFVRVATDLRLPFTGLFTSSGVRIDAEAVAAVVGQGNYCVLALERTARTGIDTNGNPTVDLGCGLMSNAPATQSVTAGGSSWIRASPIAAVGGVPDSASYQRPVTLLPYSIEQRDPFAGVSMPVPNGNGRADPDVKPNRTENLSPGTYRGFSVQGRANLAPGVYIINGGTLDFGSQAVVSGEGVTFVLTGPTAATVAKVNMNGGATVQLTAPTAGNPTAGILFFQDRAALDSGDNKINGNSSSRYQGAIYFPAQEIEYTGTTGMDTRCIQLVARRVVLRGNATITNVCPATSGAGAIPGLQVRLVG